jgi:hypothetical protein
MFSTYRSSQAAPAGLSDNTGDQKCTPGVSSESEEREGTIESAPAEPLDDFYAPSASHILNNSVSNTNIAYHDTPSTVEHKQDRDSGYEDNSSALPDDQVHLGNPAMEFNVPKYATNLDNPTTEYDISNYSPHSDPQQVPRIEEVHEASYFMDELTRYEINEHPFGLGRENGFDEQNIFGWGSLGGGDGFEGRF